MNLDNIPFLMALLWQGFSLPFITIILFQRLAPQFERGGENIHQVIPFGIRLVLAVLTLLGALGAATLLGRYRSEFPGTDVTFVVGLALGVLIALTMRTRPKRKSAA